VLFRESAAHTLNPWLSTHCSSLVSFVGNNSQSHSRNRDYPNELPSFAFTLLPLPSSSDNPYIAQHHALFTCIYVSSVTKSGSPRIREEVAHHFKKSHIQERMVTGSGKGSGQGKGEVDSQDCKSEATQAGTWGAESRWVVVVPHTSAAL
jgi:hypothetical protein